MFEMADVGHAAVRTAFGTSLSAERKAKYSSDIHIQHTPTGFVYRVYMCYGEWRIGSVERFTSLSMYHTVAKQLHKQLGELSVKEAPTVNVP